MMRRSTSLESSRIGIVGTLLTSLLVSVADCEEPSGPHHQSLIDGITFTLADGLRIEKVADQPLVKWPIVADWDPQGRLVIAESGGVGWPIQEHNKQKLHRIVRLTDTDGDGKFDDRVVAADQLAFPEGVLCLGNCILVSAPPVIWKLTDADNDGICEQREVWFDGGTVTNCANDLHGPYLGRDGLIYWCKGAFGEQTHQLRDGRTVKSSAARIYRRSFDGGPIEPIVSGGMDNPVEVASTPEGEKFFTSTFLQHPGGGLRDGIAHAVYGSVFGKDHAVLDGLTRTGPLMPVTTHLGAAAPSGLICLESNRLMHFPEAGASRVLVAALFNMQRLTAHQLVAQGASFRTVDHDLVSADRVDFHPTDVIEDADGSLLLIDTGGWYDLCCPTSRIDQKTAPGGIYRITSQATADRTIDRSSIDWQTASSSDLIALLYDSRPWIQRAAARMLQERQYEPVRSLKSILEDAGRPTDERLTALWALCQNGTQEALRVVASQLLGDEPVLAQAACHAISVHRFDEARESLETLLGHEDPQVRRTAAEALGRVGNRVSRAKLLDACESVEADRHLEHSLLYALIEISRRDPEPILTSAANSDAKLHAVLLVLDQTDQTNDLPSALLFDALGSGNPKLRQAATHILGKHPHWAVHSMDQLNGLWARISTEPELGDSLAHLVASWKDEPSVREVTNDWIREVLDLDSVQQVFLARHLTDFTGTAISADWSQSIAKWLAGANEQTQTELIQSLTRIDLHSPAAHSLIRTITTLAGETDNRRQCLLLLSALPQNQTLEDETLESKTVAAFVGDRALLPLASKVLLRVKLNKDGANRLLEAIPQVSSQFLAIAIESVERIGDDRLDEVLLTELRDLPTARTLPQGFLKNLYKDRSMTIRELAERTGDELVRPPADIKASVDRMLARLGPGDPVRGLQVFRSSKAACSGCHRMGYLGKNIGPELTKIGRSRTPEALLEAVMFPSARLEQSYQSTRILTLDGQVYNGLVRHQDDVSIELQLNAERSMVLSNDNIDRMEPSTVSVMPAGILELLTEEEISDLMALLRSAK